MSSARRRRRAALLTAAAAAGGYAAWAWYSSRPAPDADDEDGATAAPSTSSGPLATLTAWRDGAVETATAIRRARGAAVAAAALADTVARDTADFVAGDGVELPPSLRQLARLAAAPEIAQATASLAAAATAGALASVTPGSQVGGVVTAPRALASAPSPTPEAALAAVVGAACRASVREYLDAMGYAGRVPPPREASAPDLSSPDSPPRPRGHAQPRPDPMLDALSVALAWAASPEGGAAMSRAASAAAGAAVGAWLDRGAGAGGWAQLVAALCAPGNVPGAERLFRAYAGQCVETYFAGLRRDRRAARAAARAGEGGGDPSRALPPAPQSAGSADDSPLAAAGETPTRGALALRSPAARKGEDGDTASPAPLPRSASSDDYSWASEFVRVARVPEARSLAASLVASAAAASVRAAAAEAGAAARAAGAAASAAFGPPATAAAHALTERRRAATTAALVALLAVVVSALATLRAVGRAVGVV